MKAVAFGADNRTASHGDDGQPDLSQTGHRLLKRGRSFVPMPFADHLSDGLDGDPKRKSFGASVGARDPKALRAEIG